jgi:hypothetical protein
MEEQMAALFSPLLFSLKVQCAITHVLETRKTTLLLYRDDHIDMYFSGLLLYVELGIMGREACGQKF